jgi:quinol monooxygenase YgiN
MIVVLGSVEVRENAMEEAITKSLIHVHRSRTEPGCISHQVSQDCENRLRLVFVEEWADMDALQTHFKVPASGAFVAELTTLATSKPKMSLYQSQVV